MILIDGIAPKFSTFPGGEEYVDVRQCRLNISKGWLDIHVRLTDSKWVMRLVMTVDAIRRAVNTKLILSMPYVPYARQDRVCNKGESLSIRAFCNIINSLGFEQVDIFDPHSDVAGALINNCEINTKLDVISNLNFQHHLKYDFVIAPDAGAAKSVAPVAKLLNAELVVMSKRRVDDKVIYEDWAHDGKGLVVDDICDGGATFIALAKAREGISSSTVQLDLYITHGIFSKGLKELFEKYNSIITTDSFHSINALRDMRPSGMMCFDERLKVIEVF